MSKPRLRDFAKVKKHVRFLKGLGPVKWNFEMQSEKEPNMIHVFTDGETAGCWETHKSTSRGVSNVGKHLLRSWSTTQPTTATSSGGAEMLAMAEGASRGLRMRAMLSVLRATGELEVVNLFTDSSVAKSSAATRGPEKMRHLEVNFRWLQECVGHGKIAIQKIAGTYNVAGVLAKYRCNDELEGLLAGHGFVSGQRLYGALATGGGGGLHTSAAVCMFV